MERASPAVMKTIANNLHESQTQTDGPVASLSGNGGLMVKSPTLTFYQLTRPA